MIICNDPDSFDNTYRRYLLSVLRDELPFPEVPIRLFFRKREPSDRRDDVESQTHSGTATKVEPPDSGELGIPDENVHYVDADSLPEGEYDDSMYETVDMDFDTDDREAEEDS